MLVAFHRGNNKKWFEDFFGKMDKNPGYGSDLKTRIRI